MRRFYCVAQLPLKSLIILILRVVSSSDETIALATAISSIQPAKVRITSRHLLRLLHLGSTLTQEEHRDRDQQQLHHLEDYQQLRDQCYLNSS